MIRSLALAVLVAAPALAADPPPFFFKPNDRVVFLGDSITEQYQYSTYMELYLTTRFPAGNMTFINAGIGGDTANGGSNRFQSHVLDEKPTAITINFGMNDAGYGKFNPDTNKVYVAKTAAMLEAAKAAGARVALCSPNAVDRRLNPGFKQYVETQKEFYAPLKDLAAKHGAAFADQYAVTRAAVEAMEKVDPTAKTAKPYYDGFHTSPPGGLLMAHAILTQLGAPAEVSNVVIDVSKPEPTATNAKVEKLTANEKGVSFTRTDAAIPMPIQNDWRSMLPFTNELKDLNYYGLTVKGLAGGSDAKYDVKVDGKVVGTFTPAELAAGVNLGNANSGPLFDQGNAVFQAINQKNNLVRDRFGVARFNPPGWLNDLSKEIGERKRKEMTARMPKIDEAQAGVYKLAAPKAHEFTVTPAK